MLDDLRPILKDHFSLDARRPDGTTLRDHLESAERQTGRTPERLNTEPIPLWAQWHIGIWADLSAGRTYSGFGYTPLSWVDIQAWAAITRTRMTRGDLRIVRAIDSAWAEASAEQQPKPDAKKPRAN